MSLRVCLGCSCRYAVGPQVCPQCGAPTRDAVYDWEDDVAKANAVGITTYYVAEGQPVPGDLPEGVVAVGPGAPAPEPPPARAPKQDWAAHAVAVAAVPPAQAQAMTKAELVETVRGTPAQAPLVPAAKPAGEGP